LHGCIALGLDGIWDNSEEELLGNFTFSSRHQETSFFKSVLIGGCFFQLFMRVEGKISVSLPDMKQFACASLFQKVSELKSFLMF